VRVWFSGAPVRATGGFSGFPGFGRSFLMDFTQTLKKTD